MLGVISTDMKWIQHSGECNAGIVQSLEFDIMFSQHDSAGLTFSKCHFRWGKYCLMFMHQDRCTVIYSWHRELMFADLIVINCYHPLFLSPHRHSLTIEDQACIFYYLVACTLFSWYSWIKSTSQYEIRAFLRVSDVGVRYQEEMNWSFPEHEEVWCKEMHNGAVGCTGSTEREAWPHNAGSILQQIRWCGGAVAEASVVSVHSC